MPNFAAHNKLDESGGSVGPGSGSGGGDIPEIRVKTAFNG